MENFEDMMEESEIDAFISGTLQGVLEDVRREDDIDSFISGTLQGVLEDVRQEDVELVGFLGDVMRRVAQDVERQTRRSLSRFSQRPQDVTTAAAVKEDVMEDASRGPTGCKDGKMKSKKIGSTEADFQEPNFFIAMCDEKLPLTVPPTIDDMNALATILVGQTLERARGVLEKDAISKTIDLPTKVELGGQNVQVTTGLVASATNATTGLVASATNATTGLVACAVSATNATTGLVACAASATNMTTGLVASAASVTNATNVTKPKKGKFRLSDLLCWSKPKQEIQQQQQQPTRVATPEDEPAVKRPGIIRRMVIRVFRRRT